MPHKFHPARFKRLMSAERHKELPPGPILEQIGLRPGQTFVDPLISRLLGAALLALAFSSLLGWLAKSWAQVALLVQTEAVFCLLGALAILAVAVTGEREMRLIAWLDLGLLALFGAAWILAWMKRG